MPRVELSPGIADPLCGWAWVWQHIDDVYPDPHIELITPTSRYCMTIRKPEVMREVVKVMKGR